MIYTESPLQNTNKLFPTTLSPSGRDTLLPQSETPFPPTLAMTRGGRELPAHHRQMTPGSSPSWLLQEINSVLAEARTEDYLCFKRYVEAW